MHRNPYAKYIEGEDLLTSLEQTAQTIDALVRGWPRPLDERSYAPGKWSAREILLHLAHCEMVFATRLRFALSQDDYVLQPFDQDGWMGVEAQVPAMVALDAYTSLRATNLALLRQLTAENLARHLTHPEFGDVTVEWVIAWFAGHERNHLPQLRAIADARA